MKITVIGSGYVGLVTGACLAEVGNDVLCLDVNERKIDRLNNGDVPIYESGLSEIIKRNVAASRLQFSSNIEAAAEHGEVQFISFMNEIAELAEKVDADVEDVRRGIGSDPRIGYHFLYAGCGYGGSCFPKDVKALVRMAADVETDAVILNSVEQRNSMQKALLGERVIARFGGDLRNRRFAIWGLAFKPNTDDMREAPSRHLIQSLLEKGAKVFAYDPVSMPEAKAAIEADLEGQPWADNVRYVSDKMDALANSDALIVLIEWKEFRSQDLTPVRSLLKHPIIFDGRNIYELGMMDSLGIEYYGIGRKNEVAKARVSTASMT
ncbi:UDP-glucose dehydrogenase family protein [Paraburkholderia sp. J94]|uniref:UDP-glucose dehydrogenase family protein n=1 Tax=Paraburkholderia sp. J94 TaxID=2805441 RepID=UPI002AB2DCB1|nr:UDP binding domain-containing protein [Paraburkholderia sp. J94]